MEAGWDDLKIKNLFLFLCYFVCYYDKNLFGGDKLGMGEGEVRLDSLFKML